VEKKNNFPDLIFDMHFHKIFFKTGIVTFIVLTIIVPVFDLGMYVIRRSLGLEIYIFEIA